MRIQVEQEVRAPVERVWAIITDLARSPEVMSGLDEVEILAGGEQFGVGTRWRETRTMFGKKATEDMQIVAVEPGRSYDVVAESHGSRYESSLTVVPSVSGSCVLTMTFQGVPTSTASRVLGATLGRLLVAPTRKAIERDLADLAAAAEAAVGDDSRAGPPSQA